MFEQLAIALAQAAVVQVMKFIGTKVTEAVLDTVEETKTTLTYDGEDLHVQVEPDVIVAEATQATRKAASHPTVARWLSSIPAPVRIFLTTLLTGLKQSLFESLTTQLFNREWASYNEGKTA